MWPSIVEGVGHHWVNKTLHLVNDVMVKCEVLRWSVMVGVGVCLDPTDNLLVWIIHIILERIIHILLEWIIP